MPTIMPSTQGGQTQPDDLRNLYDANGNFDIRGVLGFLQNAQTRNRDANQGRLDRILGELNTGYATASAGLEGQGQTGIARLLRQRDETNASNEASLTARGFGGSTLVDNMRESTRRTTDEGIADILERVGLAKSGLAERRAQSISGVLERVSEPGPDTGAFLSLVQQQSALQEERRAREEERKREENRRSTPVRTQVINGWQYEFNEDGEQVGTPFQVRRF